MKKKMAQLHRRPWFLWIGGACFLVGSILFSAIGLASPAGPPSVTVTADQGAAGASPWPVSASGTVGVNNFPSTQNVSGTVGIDQGANGVSVKNLPATQNVSGSVSISGTPSVASGDKTVSLYNNSSLSVAPNGGSAGTPTIDTSNARTIRVWIGCDAQTASLLWSVAIDGSLTIAKGDLSSSGFVSQTLDVPGTSAFVQIANIDSVSHTCTIAVDGRSN